MKITNRDEFFKFIETLEGKDKHKILTECVQHLFNTVGKDDLLKVQGKKMYFQDREMGDHEVQMLIEETKLFRGSKLWKVLQLDMRYQANKRMFVDSKTIEDLIAGKLLLLLIDVLETRLKEIK